ncbi:ABC transporter ATP-binding protein [Candidatus Dependentiae bacterium Noda2021]|nr:ABC transporter ATP-binding protein [Candidatus Dependentiae bacterium Noda2021]
MLILNSINSSHGAQQILYSISCKVAQGEFVIIVGGNGAGKTTLLDTIAGKIKPTSGTIYLNGHDITAQSEAVRAKLITRIFQNTHLNSVGAMTVWQNLAMTHYAHRAATLANGMKRMSYDQAHEIITSLGFDESVLHKNMSSLSGGQRQLISFAMSTQRIPQLLLLDEPTAALDPHAATRLLVHAKEFIKYHKVTTIMITHDPHIALSMADTIWVLENGQITKQFNKKDIKDLKPEQLIGHIDYTQLKS